MKGMKDMKGNFRKASCVLSLVGLLVGCASHAAPQTQQPPPLPATSPRPAPAPGTLPENIKWMQNSAEYVAIAVQTYRLATARVEADARGRKAGSWGVVLDADDTVINNIEYQAGL